MRWLPVVMVGLPEVARLASKGNVQSAKCKVQSAKCKMEKAVMVAKVKLGRVGPVGRSAIQEKR